jgi:hypothetical protein
MVPVDETVGKEAEGLTGRPLAGLIASLVAGLIGRPVKGSTWSPDPEEEMVDGTPFELPKDDPPKELATKGLTGGLNASLVAGLIGRPVKGSIWRPDPEEPVKGTPFEPEAHPPAGKVETEAMGTLSGGLFPALSGVVMELSRFTWRS